MTISIKKLVVLGTLAALMIFSVATSAHADWHGQRGGGWGEHEHYGWGGYEHNGWYGRGYWNEHPYGYAPVVVGAPPVYMVPQPVYSPPLVVPAYGYGPSLTIGIR